MWSSAIARVVPYSGEGGAYVKINPLEDAIDKEYKRQLDAEKSFERDFDFFRGDQALLEQEQRDLFLQATAPIKPGVQELFNTNPELASVGTPEQYSAYLNSIFPDSKVKDIVYHGTHTRFNKFDKSLSGSKTKASINGKGFFFSNSLGIAQGYRQSLEQSNIYNDVIFYYYFKRDLANKNIKDLTQEEWQEIVLNYFGSEDLNAQYLQRQSLDKTKQLFEKFKNDKQFDTVQYSDELDFSEYLKDDSIVYSALLGVNNPLVVEGNNYQMLSIVKKEIEKLEENNDSIIFNNVEDGMSGSYRGVANTYTVFEPEQIHILGNENDVQGFRQFVSERGTSLQKTAEETLPPIASPETLKLVKDFLKRIGVDVNVMKEIVVNGIKYDANGVAQITQQLISVVEGKEAQALPEEAMHFAVSIIKQTNPKLYQKLMKEINGYNMLNSVFAEYGNNPLYQKDGKPDVIKLKEEAIAKVLVEKIITGVENTTEKPEDLAKAQSWWRDILNWIKSLIYQKSGFDQAAIDIISGKEIGTAKDIREDNAVEFLQQTTQESLFNNIKNTSDRIDKQVDQNNPAKEERYFLDGIKKIARRVSDLTKDFFERRRKQQDLVQSEYEKAVTDLKAEKGTNGHLDFEHAFNMFTDENGFLKSPEEIERLILEDDHISFIDPNDNDIYEILRDNLLERMQAFEAASPGTRFLKEVSIYDPSRDIAGTIDFMAIGANGKINILDWKFMGLNTEKYDEIPWYKVQSWRIQMEQYKLILKNNYGVKDQDFGQTRMIPILTKWSKGKPKKNILPRLTDIKIGDVVVKNISEDEGYLIPVATKGELTGNKKIDALLERLNTAYERFSDVKVPASEKKNKAEQLNALFSAIMRLHMQQDVAPLLKQVAILHKQINSLVD